MNYHIISHTGSRRLILIFAGWAMDWRPMKNLRRPGYDIAVVWGYGEGISKLEFAEVYDEICLVAWSLGVAIAPEAVGSLKDRITLTVAVNGTMSPVDDRRGIPEAIFRGTLEGLDSRSLTKFYRRVTGSREAYEAFASDLPEADLEALRRELAMFATYIPKEMRWDTAVIGKRDAIFPPDNMVRSWAGKARTVITDEAHLPDFQAILNRFVINKTRVEERFGAGRTTYDSAAAVQADMAARMVEILENGGVNLQGASALEVGCGTGLLTSRLDGLIGPEGSLEMIDIAGEAPVEGPGRAFRRGDAELLVRSLPGGSYDLIISASTVQWFHSQRSFMAECRRLLRCGGYVCIGTYVDGNLPEVKELTGASLPLLSASDWQSIIGDDWRTCAFTTYDHRIRFDSPIDAFRHLKLTGVNSLEPDRDGGDKLRKALRNSSEPFELTYRALIFLIQKID